MDRLWWYSIAAKTDKTGLVLETRSIPSPQVDSLFRPSGFAAAHCPRHVLRRENG
jgi:hypothetical protein